MRKAYKAQSVQFNAKARLQSKFQCNSLLQNAWIGRKLTLKSEFIFVNFFTGQEPAY